MSVYEAISNISIIIMILYLLVFRVECHLVREPERNVLNVLFVDNISSLPLRRILLVGTKRNANAIIHNWSKLKIHISRNYSTNFFAPRLFVDFFLFSVFGICLCPRSTTVSFTD